MKTGEVILGVALLTYLIGLATASFPGFFSGDTTHLIFFSAILTSILLPLATFFIHHHSCRDHKASPHSYRSTLMHAHWIGGGSLLVAIVLLAFVGVTDVAGNAGVSSVGGMLMLTISLLLYIGIAQATFHIGKNYSWS